MIEKMSDQEMQEEFSLPRFQPPTGYIDYETTTLVSMETHIPENNVGYKLLQKMGWSAGKGLGPQLQGIFVLTFGGLYYLLRLMIHNRSY